MARERKPLIEPGSVLPSADTLSRILERDRQASGRKRPATTGADEPLVEKNEGTPPLESTEAETEQDITSNITAHSGSKEYEQEGRKSERNASARKVAQQSGKRNAQTYAKELAATRAIPITLRLPEGLNDWLDDYAHEHRKRGVKKQDLIARAVELLVIALSAEELAQAKEEWG